MKIFSLSIVVLFICITFQQLTAQKLSALERIQIQERIQFQEWNVSQDAKDFIEIHKADWGLSDKDQLIEQSVKSDFTGMKRIRYQQYHKGIPVIGAVYTLHLRNDKILKSSGILFPHIHCATQPNLERSQAEQMAKAFAFKHIKAEHASVLPQLSLQAEKAKLCIIDRSFPQHSGHYVLAYEIRVNSLGGLPVRDMYYLNADNGSMIAHHSEICSHQKNVPASGYHYKDVHITVDSINPDRYQLLDSARNIQINRMINDDPMFPEFETIWNTDNHWHYDENDLDGAAADAMYCAAAYYDFLQGHFNRSGIDDANGPMICNVNIPSFSGGYFFSNAYWDGVSTNYGTGDCKGYGPFTTLSIVSHEFTHGLTDYTSDLVYSGESGALNESMSDIFGETLEYYADSANFSWAIGNKLVVPGGMSEPIRDMKDPNIQDDPKYYKGEHWDVSEGVHTNSGVMNHWYYLIVEGGADTNEVGYVYDLEGMGVDKAIQIAYLMQTAYLTPTSDYEMAHLSSVSAAEDLYGPGSAELAIVEEAWKIVGVSEREVPADNLSVYLDAGVFLTPICLNEIEVNLNIILDNTGSDTLDLTDDIGFEVVLGFSFNPILEDIAIVNPSVQLAPGEEVAVQLSLVHNGSISLDKLGDFENIQVEILRPDEDNSDNLVENYGIFINIDPDLSILQIEPQYEGEGCDEEVLSGLELIYENLSCSTLPGGTDLQFIFTNGMDEYPFDETVLFDVEPEGFGFQSLFLSPDMFEDYYGPVELVIRYEEDNNPLNDTLSIGSWRQRSLDTQSLDFNEDIETEFLKLESAQAEPVTYLNDQWLAFNDISHEFLDYTTCYEGVEEHFDLNTPTKGLIELCVDTREFISEPKLIFNAVFFDGYDTTSLIPEHLATMFDVRVDGERQALIYQQVEGEIENYEFSLPENFVGRVEINVSAYYRDAFVNHELGSGSWVLFDDFRIEGTTSAQEPSQNTAISVYPNPTTDRIILDIPPSFEIKGVELFDLPGRIVEEFQSYRPGEDLDISSLSEGTYFLRITGKDQKSITKKLIIQR